MPDYQLRPGALTDIGHVRAFNQDHLLAADGLYVVADGCGDGSLGQSASRTAVDVFKETFAADRTARGLHDAAVAADQAVRDLGGGAAEFAGTTLTALAVVHEDDEPRLSVLNVGDSRAYLLHDGALARLTEDHTLVAELVRSGELAQEDVASHPDRHILTRVVGGPTEVVADVVPVEPAAGDRLLLCSDGLTNELSDGEIAAVLRTTHDADEAAAALVELAKAKGGSDNITAVVLDVDLRT